MKIGILTLPLHSNYGGILQAYALQTILQKIGHCAIVFNIEKKYTQPHNWMFVYIKRLVKKIIGKTTYVFAEKKAFKNYMLYIHEFISGQIFKMEINHLSDIDCQRFDSLIVGSDQVWRKTYFESMWRTDISGAYFKFAENRPVKRIAYAASFGVADWEYTPKQTRECSRLAKKFDAISVREESGVKLCKEHLGVNATWVLDPTLLLTKEDYLPICEEVPVCNKKYLAVYVLDECEEVMATYEKEAAARGLIVKKFHADSKSTLTVPEWLAMFRDASYVVTDSFHGTVFSIIFGKEFKCIYNKGRGATRFESLMNLYNSGKLEEMREFSLNWLKKALEN